LLAACLGFCAMASLGLPGLAGFWGEFPAILSSYDPKIPFGLWGGTDGTLWTFRTSGVMISDPRRPYVVVANHQSFVDILLISHLPWEMKWLSKADFFKYPLVGWMMHMAGDIKLIRGKRDSIIAAADAYNSPSGTVARPIVYDQRLARKPS
jgi:1-acyl-sn-glycerol-3-phosphate acyltransferase